jgi:hypothetical protein
MSPTDEIEPMDAAQELDRVRTLGPEVFGDAESRQRWIRRMHDGWLWESAVVVIAVPQAILVALGRAPSSLDFLALGGGLPAAWYLIVSVLGAPDLPPRLYRLWLFLKVVATTLISVALAAILIAGPLGLIGAVPLSVVAGISAIGTASVRRGHTGGVIFPIAVFAILGFVCMGMHFGTAVETDAIRAAEIVAFSIAGVAALLGLFASGTVLDPGRYEAR